MPSINEKLRDASIGRAVDLGQYSNNLVRRTIALFNRMDVDLSARLAAALTRMPRTSATVQHLDSQLTSLRELNRQAHDDALRMVSGELRGLTEHEADYQRELFGGLFADVPQIAVSSINAEAAFAAVTAQPFQGRLLREWFGTLEKNKADRIRDAVRTGYAEGQTIAEIVQRVRGTRANGYADGIIAIDRRNAEAVVRTAVSHTASVARERFYDANSDLLEGKQWLSTLDSRTSKECGVRDHLVYDRKNKPVGHSVPWKAGPGRLHYCCRSTSCPITKSWKALGIDMPEFKSSQRASMDGQVAGGTTYQSWLERQSAARQDQILGPTRGQLLRDGSLPVEKMWDSKGRYLSLEDMRTRYNLKT